VLTPAILVYPIRRLQLEDTTRAMLYLGILVTTLVLSLLVTNYGVPWDGAELSRRLRGKLKREGTPIDDSNAVFVGLSPGASPRGYDFSYDWDVGWLFFTRERVCYFGRPHALCAGPRTGCGDSISRSCARLVAAKAPPRDLEGRERLRRASTQSASGWRKKLASV
jgi:hypothetical protein